MEAPTLQVETRTETGSKALPAIREEGKVPGVMYGPGKEHSVIKVDSLTLQKLYDQVGESLLVDVVVDGKDPIKALISDMQIDPLSREPIHVDFYLVDMTKKIQTDVDLEFVGVSAAIKNLGGTLLRVRDSIEIEALPDKLIGSIVIDISQLETFEDMIRIKDLDIPEGIEVLDGENLMVAKIEAPRTEEEMAALDEEITDDLEGVEVEGAKDEEGEEGAEGVEGEEDAEAPKEGESKEESKEE